MLSPKPTKRPPMSTSTSSHASLSPTAATPTASSTSLAPKHTAPSQPEEDRTKTFIEWYCKDCDKACVHIRSENRCLCGHRFKEHKQGHGSKGWKCSSHKCPCDGFFYVFGQGALVLKCRCKHKHIEHDSSKKPYKCVKSGCKCSAFDSPWRKFLGSHFTIIELIFIN